MQEAAVVPLAAEEIREPLIAQAAPALQRVPVVTEAPATF
jgi:hypothetical protein